MAAFLDIMYYYAIFNYDRDSFNSMTNNTSSEDDDKKERMRMSKEDVDLIPEITYDPTTDSETSAARHHIYTKFSAARHQLSPSTLSPLLLTKAAAATEATIELSSSAENAKLCFTTPSSRLIQGLLP